ncbi:hypothetical protein HU200_052242 [Digitaria exilis]|uniref:Disease resistance N-terminal domain-containing protein n=1 Tax=Digitaria exilis TaxID=1010633 RepID=A0A835AZ53_9POAL|nr:hypothetical protein HU200_052242 [Digitaria exilis]
MSGPQGIHFPLAIDFPELVVESTSRCLSKPPNRASDSEVAPPPRPSLPALARSPPAAGQPQARSHRRGLAADAEGKEGRDASARAWLRELRDVLYLLRDGFDDFRRAAALRNQQGRRSTLNVSDCWNLFRLPRDMKYMASLRHLYTEGCKSLKSMPPDLGELSSLQILTYFVVGASSGCSTVEGLRNLDLGGKLILDCLENVTEAQAKAAALENKEILTYFVAEYISSGVANAMRNRHLIVTRRY